MLSFSTFTELNMRELAECALPELDAPIWGAAAIGTVIGQTERATAHLIRTGELPVRRIGRRFVSTRRALLQRLTPTVA
jgi:hypothetical protein